MATAPTAPTWTEAPKVDLAPKAEVIAPKIETTEAPKVESVEVNEDGLIPGKPVDFYTIQKIERERKAKNGE